MPIKTVLLVTLAALAAGVAVVAWKFAFFIAPLSWTGEPDRLRDVLDVGPGAHVADIGAGTGALAAAMARIVGSTGVVYATEISPERQQQIGERIRSESLPHMRVIAGAAAATNLPESCCDAVYMRAVFHHVEDQAGFARAVAAAVRRGGRAAIIDFAPGALWFHGKDHGVTAETVARAFQSAGLRQVRHIEDWGGGMFLILFQRPGSPQVR